MAHNFANAPEPSMGGGGPLIPEGTLIGGTIELQRNPNGELVWFNANSGNRYMKAWITIAKPTKYAGQKVLDVIGIQGTEGLMTMSDIKIRAILETNGAGPENPERYSLNERTDINGMKAACKLVVDTKSDKPRNQVGTFLSPIAQSTKSDFDRLKVGDTAPPDHVLLNQTEIPGARRIVQTPPPPRRMDPAEWLDDPGESAYGT